MIKTNMKVSASLNLSGPGTYGVTATGITLTLPVWTSWPDLESIKIKDLTGQSNPNITVKCADGGTIDGDGSVTLTQAFESLTFDPFINGNTWTVS